MQLWPAPREKLDSEFSEEENKLEMADTQAEIILSQGLPRHIFNNLNQTSTAKEIWDNVEMLMQGSACECMKDTQLNIPPSDEHMFVHNPSGLWGKYSFNPPNNQLRTPPTQGLKLLTCYDGQIVTEPVQRKHQVMLLIDSALGNKVIFTTARRRNMFARQCKEPKRKWTLTNHEMHMTSARRMKDSNAASRFHANLIESGDAPGSNVNSDADTEIDDNTIRIINTHKVKLDLEHKVRQEQALVIQRNKRNAELVQENDLLKVTLSGKEKSITILQSEKEKIYQKKKLA
ncbi:hypothetical protein Tco_1329242 [Tanacetum coccineum]